MASTSNSKQGISSQIQFEDTDDDSALSDGSECSDLKEVSRLENDEDEIIIGSSSDEASEFIFHKSPKRQKRRRNTLRPQNSLTEKPGVRGNGVGVKSFVQAWNLFISEDMIEDIVRNTNISIQKKLSLYERPRDCKITDAFEIRALFGLLYVAGSLGIPNASLDGLFATDGTGIPIFAATMSLKRMKFLLSLLNFCDDDPSHSSDIAAPIRNVIEKFRHNCSLPYSVGHSVVIDEMVIPYEEKCPINHYVKSIKSISSKFGIALYTLVDATTNYVLNFELCPSGRLNQSNDDESGTDILKRLIIPVSGTGRILTACNWYITEHLVADLAQNHNLSVVGYSRKTKNDMPLSRNKKKRKTNKIDLVDEAAGNNISYINANIKDESVQLISSLNFLTGQDERKNEELNQNVVNFYNKTKRAVSAVDIKAQVYSTSRLNKRWALTIFFRLLDIAGMNAVIVLKENGVVIEHRWKYLRKLGIELTKDNMEIRASMVTQKGKLRTYINNQINFIKPKFIPTSDRAICKICPAVKRRQTKNQCVFCFRHVCKKHITVVCKECYKNTDDTEEIQLIESDSPSLETTIERDFDVEIVEEN